MTGASGQQTDGTGRFVMERVLPEHCQAFHEVHHGMRMSRRYKTLLRVVPGETQNITLAGTGRPVVGRVRTPRLTLLNSAQEGIVGTIYDEPPPAPIPPGLCDAEKQAWYRTWRTSEAGKAHEYASRSYRFPLEKDGSFRAPDIPSGKYALDVKVLAPPDPSSHRCKTLASVKCRFAIPDNAGNAECAILWPLGNACIFGKTCFAD